jgi:iron-sulfur cluster assembly accessory protein
MSMTTTDALVQLTVTEAAATAVKQFMADESAGSEAGLRIRVVPGGCSGFQYDMVIDEAPGEGDDIVQTQGIRVFVDPVSKQYLNGVELDYVNSMMGSGFTFKNPNATGGCGCGNSFSV